MPTVLLEIGTEELPAAYLPPALAQLAALARARLQAERLHFEELFTWGTPRRIALQVTGIATHQAPAMREVRGPAVSAAFASNGEPTQAAMGFARSQGIPVNQLHIKTIDNAEYVVAIFHDEGHPTLDLLPGIFAQLITSLSFPKTMRWGQGNFRFARPIRWLVALLDEQVVPFAVDAVTAGRLTRGHRFLAPGEVGVPTAADYRRIMEENQVLVVPEQRREVIREQLTAIAAQEHAVIVDDGALLEEATFHVEYPTAVRGGLEESFLSLPDEVLLQVLRHEQNFFPLSDMSGTLLPAFLAVRNGDKAYLGAVREGYERVARAKLLDALFFFEQDIARPLAAYVEELRGVVYQERLGTLHDKVTRVEALALALAARLHLSPEEQEYVARAALLCKADLVTSMVSEHPELQGVMGRVYARRSGEPEAVAEAIGEVYRPRTTEDAIPRTLAGRIVALADKLDTVAACFTIGLVPTGSEDPYGLRREAQGVVRLLAEGGLRLALSELVALALARVPVEPAQPLEETRAALLGFLRGRVETTLVNAGITAPVVKAVLAVSADVPADALRRARVIQGHLGDPAFQTVVRLAARVTNITRNITSDGFQPDLLSEPAECALYARYQEIAAEVDLYAAEGDFAALLQLLASLAPAIDRFFNEILVMVEDPALRQTRLALLARLASLFRHLGDLTPLSS